MAKKKVLKSEGSPNPNVIGVAIGKDGAIDNPPTKFEAHKNDFVLWVFGNTSGQPITVTLMDFNRKTKESADKGDEPVMPFTWLVSNIVQIEDKQLGLIGAQRDPNYQIQGLFGIHDTVTYTIRVESRATTKPFDPIDYDPDGEIKP